MVTVAVQNLQDQLSWYLAKVKIGERVLITQHNQPIAELIQPQTDTIQDVAQEYQFLYDLASEGRAVLAKRFESTAKAPKIAHEESVDVMSLLNETRADRF
jgi:antitoxin (DNA-binding transcriptional repressor) of toxin-antitoxin stability system